MRTLILLRADNVTPTTRTPWGGRRIAGEYKRDLGLSLEPVIGESWEVSVAPSFPSRVEGSGELLSEVIAAAPDAWLGSQVAERFGGQNPLLVKLLDSEDNLSLQVHPALDDTRLEPDETGKFEAWIVLRAQKGAGIYLGFRDGVERRDVAHCIRSNGPLDSLMNFVPVSPGDVFSVVPGVPHAVGAGLTLLEPQHVVSGRRALTYRFWDWNRRYDRQGCADPEGRPRPLHLERALEVTNWSAPRGQRFVASCRVQGRAVEHPGTLARDELLAGEHFVVERWAGQGSLSLAPDTMLALTCVAGTACLRSADEELTIRCGQSAVVAGCVERLDVSSTHTELIVSRTVCS